MNSEKQSQSTGQQKKRDALAPYHWKPGQSGNPKGRPKDKTMKEYVKEMLERMTPEERDAFLVGMPKEVIWKMAEGNPHTTEDKQVTVTMPTPILGGASSMKHLSVPLTEEVIDVTATEPHD